MIELKVWPDQFELMRLGVKTFDVRASEPGHRPPMKAGELIVFREFDARNGKYSGRELKVVVIHQFSSIDSPREWGLNQLGYFYVNAFRILEERP